MDTDILTKYKCSKTVRGRNFELVEWVRNVAEHTKCKPFIFRELPDKLQNRAYLRKSASREYIKCVGRKHVTNSRNYVNVWVIV